MNERHTTQQVEWNLSSAIILEIQALLNKASGYYNGHNIRKAFWTLKTLKFRFIQSLDKPEREELKTIEKDFIDNHNSKGKVIIIYENYAEKIMDLLDSYGYLLQRKKDSTRIS